MGRRAYTLRNIKATVVDVDMLGNRLAERDQCQRGTPCARTPAIGYVCSYTPVEILHAAGIPAKRLLGKLDWESDEGLLCPTVCGYVRSVLGEIADSDPWLLGLVVVNACTNLQHLYNVAVSEFPGIFVYPLDVPRRTDEAAVQFFAESLRCFVAAVSAQFGISITTDALAGALEESVKTGRLLAEVQRLQVSGRIPGSAALTLFEAWGACGYDEVELAVRQVVEGSRAEGGVPKVVVSGSLLRRQMIVELEDMGIQVVTCDLCNGVRSGWEGIVGDCDPYVMLARKYLQRLPCPRMVTKAERVRFLIDAVRTSGAGGLVYFALKFCDNHLFDYPAVRSVLNEHGIPSLLIEWEYGQRELSGQARTRLQAFVEMLSGGV